MTKSEVLSVFERWRACRRTSGNCTTSCKDCPHNVEPEEFRNAVEVAIAAFRSQG